MPHVSEHRTKLEFPLRIPKNTYGNDQELLSAGTALRAMLGMSWIPLARAYSFGIFVSPDGLQTVASHPDVCSADAAAVVTLAESFGTTGTTGSLVGAGQILRTPEQNVNSALLDDILRGASGQVGVVLRMSRDIDGPHLANGFKNSSEV